MGARMFQQSSQHVASYYAHSCADRLLNRAALEGEQNTEVLIIGAGFSGLHTALRLPLARKRVTLLEASRVAWAASGRNGGHLNPLKLALDPAAAIERAGGCIYEQSKALSYREAGDQYVVTTECGSPGAGISIS